MMFSALEMLNESFNFKPYLEKLIVQSLKDSTESLPVSRICLQHLNATLHAVTVYQESWALSKDNAEEEDKDAFYDALQSVLEDIPQHDVLMLLGDFNAKVCDNKDGKRTMGRHGVDVITNNGERLVNFCQQNNLVIRGTLLAHKEIHKLTWTSPDGRTQNQINHIIITYTRSIYRIKYIMRRRHCQ
ncbi:craniofacial development protein 2-like [Dreissena polymorpha]|uniref:craniofacial development protein 2-like n=1 Tax=Dreissena polymorpha TaxID=45954 RepID=UPI0022647B50|nr:craniofacial development protein 2-like [Dreissena polymorpha]